MVFTTLEGINIQPQIRPRKISVWQFGMVLFKMYWNVELRNWECYTLLWEGFANFWIRKTSADGLEWYYFRCIEVILYLSYVSLYCWPCYLSLQCSVVILVHSDLPKLFGALAILSASGEVFFYVTYSVWVAGFFIWAMTCDFQQCGILLSVDSDEPLQPPFKLRGSKLCLVSSLVFIEY